MTHQHPDRMRPTALSLLAGAALLLLGLGAPADTVGPSSAAPDASPDTIPDTIKAVQARGVLRCGGDGADRGLSWRDQHGDWSGMEVDFCRAVAAAVLGAPERVEFVALRTNERLPALRDGRVDLLLSGTTWTANRDLTEGVSFVGALVLDGQGFLVPRSTAILTAAGLDDARLCAIADTTSAANAKDWFAQRGLNVTLHLVADIDAATAAYRRGKCTALTTDLTQLHGLPIVLEHPEAHRILPDVISKEPLGPAVRKGDARWFDLVRWTLFTLIAAEELGIDRSNVSINKTRSGSVAVRTLLDLDGVTGAALGVEPQWGYRVLLAVGNYGEVFERNLGGGSALGLARGRNALWRDGGVLYAPPLR